MTCHVINKFSPSAMVLADSINPNGNRLTTMQVDFHRFELASINTHRAFSRNSASSRAIPLSKQIDRIMQSPAIPIEFGSKQAGMQPGPPLEDEELDQAIEVWLGALSDAISAAQSLDALGVHKQVSNRLLEPFMGHTAIITATEWGNFFDQRVSQLAQKEIQVPAELMKEALDASTPILVKEGGWHTPLILDDEQDLDLETKKKVSVARCARVSYMTHDGKRDLDKDIELYEKLVTATPPHYSPSEHIATPSKDGDFTANFVGWTQLRHYNEG